MRWGFRQKQVSTLNNCLNRFCTNAGFARQCMTLEHLKPLKPLLVSIIYKQLKKNTITVANDNIFFFQSHFQKFHILFLFTPNLSNCYIICWFLYI